MKYARYVIAISVLFLGLCSGAMGQETKLETAVTETKQEAKPEAKQGTHEGPEVKEKRVVATIGADGVQRVELIGDSYSFDPNYIVVKVNVPVELAVKKAPGITPHDIVVKAPEAGIDFKTDLNDKKPELIKFTPTKVGKYALYCGKKLLWFKSHRERGMEGVIEVVE
jgi:plastocyanin